MTNRRRHAGAPASSSRRTASVRRVGIPGHLDDLVAWTAGGKRK